MGAPLKQNPEPNDESYRANLHAANLNSAREEQERPEETNFSGQYAPPSGDDYEINRSPTQFSDMSADVEDGDDQSDFEAGYNSAVGDGSFLKEKLVSWTVGIFSPPGTGPMFGSGASLIQWIFREDDQSETSNENEET